jgi:hypothetical protein
LDFRTARFQLGPQFSIIFDDSVVNDHDRSRAMWVCIALGRLPVCRPSGVADPDSALERTLSKIPFEILQLSLGTTNLEHISLQNRDPSRVVPAIFQPTKSVDQDIRRTGLTPYITHDSTHIATPEYDLTNAASR